jgi:hypothetical protein
MNRRSFLAALAALPIVGKWVPKPEPAWCAACARIKKREAVMARRAKNYVALVRRKLSEVGIDPDRPYERDYDFVRQEHVYVQVRTPDGTCT